MLTYFNVRCAFSSACALLSNAIRRFEITSSCRRSHYFKIKDLFVRIFLSCSLDRFKSIFLLEYFNRALSAKRLEHFFAGAARRAFPVVRQVFKPSASGDFAFTVSPVRIIKISAVNRLALIHFFGFGLYLLL